jgi:hypothetical protein
MATPYKVDLRLIDGRGGSSGGGRGGGRGGRGGGRGGGASGYCAADLNSNNKVSKRPMKRRLHISRKVIELIIE